MTAPRSFDFDTPVALVSCETGEMIWRGKLSEFWKENSGALMLRDWGEICDAIAVRKPWLYDAGAGGVFVLSCLAIELEQFEGAWSKESPDFPLCALCGKKIGSDRGDGDEPIAVRSWRKQNGATEEIAFHVGCFQCVRVPAEISSVKQP